MTTAFATAAHYVADGWPEDEAAARFGVDADELRRYIAQRGEREPAVPEIEWPEGTTTQRPNGAIAQSRADPADSRPLVRVDLVELARSGIPPPRFAIDGYLYRGYVHSLTGPPDAGKTTLAMWWMLTVLRAGEPVMLLDEESGPETVVEKLLALGADPGELARLAYYPFPGRGWDPLDLAGLHQEIETVAPAMLLGDSMSALLSAGGRDEDRAGDVRRFIQRVLLEPARRYGHAALYIDHVRKDGAGGRYARGSGDKLAAVDVAYVVQQVKAFHREQSGLARLTVTKDRRGYLHREHEVRVDVAEGRITLDVAEASSDPAAEGMSPAATKILEVLKAAGLPLTNKEIGDRVAAKFGHGLTRPTISKTCAALVSDGFADELAAGPRGMKSWMVVTDA